MSILHGQLLLGGRLTVETILPRSEAVKRLNTDALYEDAKDWAIGMTEECTPLDLNRQLAPNITRRLRFVAPSGPAKSPQFVSETELDGQTTRGVRQLTPDSAELLELVIATTDGLPRSKGMQTVRFEDLA